MAKNDDKLAPLADKSDKFLDDAKKGKPRPFLLVCKGPKITYLAVSKKPIKKSVFTDAKKAGYTGEPYFGVITGKGVDLCFNLATSDGYDAEPVKPKVLKDFLEEHAELKCQPTFAIVNEPPVVGFEGDDLNHPLIAKFTKLEPVIAKALAAKPDLAGEIRSRVDDVRGALLDEATRDGAGPALEQLVGYLKELLGAAPTTNDANQTSNVSAELVARFAAMELQLDAAKQRQPDKAAAMDKLMAFARQQAGAGNEPNAAKALDGLEQAILAATGGNQAGATTTNGGGSLPNDWEAAKTAWEEACSIVDRQISDLQTALRNSDDEDLQEIAEFGLNGVTGNLRVPLMSALMGVDQASNAPQPAMTKARSVIAEFQNHIAKDDKIAAVDDNPFGVTVAIRETYAAALARIDGVFEQAGA